MNVPQFAYPNGYGQCFTYRGHTVDTPIIIVDDITVQIRESGSINVHWRGDEETHDPRGDNHEDGGAPLPLGHILQRVEDGVEPVQADTNEAVDAGGAEGHVC